MQIKTKNSSSLQRSLAFISQHFSSVFFMNVGPGSCEMLLSMQVMLTTLLCSLW